jgi:uridine kinase
VFKSQAEPMLRAVPENCAEYSEAQRLLRFLEYIVPLQDKELPPTSLAREFLGGSSFKYWINHNPKSLVILSVAKYLS